MRGGWRGYALLIALMHMLSNKFCDSYAIGCDSEEISDAEQWVPSPKRVKLNDGRQSSTEKFIGIAEY